MTFSHELASFYQKQYLWQRGRQVHWLLGSTPRLAEVSHHQSPRRLLHISLDRPRVFDLGIAGKIYKQVVRLHVGGDFFSSNYFDAWLYVVGERPDLLAYGYTKSLQFWVNRLPLPSKAKAWGPDCAVSARLAVVAPGANRLTMPFEPFAT